LQDPISKKPFTKGLAEWLKVKTLSSSPSTAKKKKITNWFLICTDYISRVCRDWRYSSRAANVLGICEVLGFILSILKKKKKSRM
jgi:hypothetical protein